MSRNEEEGPRIRRISRIIVQPREGLQMNLTPMIDVVFILITFFLVIFRSIGQENFRLEVPDDCPGAVRADEGAGLTVSVFSVDGEVCYAVRDREMDAGGPEVVEELAAAVREMRGRFAGGVVAAGGGRTEGKMPSARGRGTEGKMPSARGEVELRADGGLTWGQVSPALVALSRAEVGTVRLAARAAGESGGDEGDRP